MVEERADVEDVFRICHTDAVQGGYDCGRIPDVAPDSVMIQTLQRRRGGLQRLFIEIYADQLKWIFRQMPTATRPVPNHLIDVSEQGTVPAADIRNVPG